MPLDAVCYSGGPFKDFGLAGACIATPVDGFIHAVLTLVYELLTPSALGLALLAAALALPPAKGRIFAADLAGHVALVGVLAGALGLTGAQWPCRCIQASIIEVGMVTGPQALIDPVLTACVLVGGAIAEFVDIPLGIALAVSSIPISICVGASSILSAFLALCVDAVLLLEFYFAPFAVRLALVIVSLVIAIAVSALRLGENARENLSQITRCLALHAISFIVAIFSVPRSYCLELLRTGARRYPGTQEWKRRKRKEEEGEIGMEVEGEGGREGEIQPLMNLKGTGMYKGARSRWAACWFIVSLLLTIIICGSMRLSIQSGK